MSALVEALCGSSVWEKEAAAVALHEVLSEPEVQGTDKDQKKQQVVSHEALLCIPVSRCAQFGIPPLLASDNAHGLAFA